MEQLFKEVDNIKDEIIELRRDFHQHPEVGSELERTSKIVADLLTKWGLEVQTNVGICGVVGILKGTNTTSNHTVALRADMDALLMDEDNSIEYQSTIKGKMHACGHDGHTAMLLGAAKVLANHKDKINGTIKFIFQPEEEGPNSGARNMIADGALEGVDAIFGLHITTEYDTGIVTLKQGPTMASCDDFEIEMIGKGGHASLPHECIDALAMGVSVYNHLQFLVSREFSPLDPILISIGSFQSGAASNVVQSSAKLKGTIRTLSPEVRKKAQRRIEEIVKQVAKEAGGDYNFKIFLGIPPLINDRSLCHFIESSLEKHQLKDKLVHLELPNMGSEDFAYYSEQIPGAFMMIGARNEEKGLVHLMHHPKFDFDEEVLPFGAKLHIQFALDYLEQHKTFSK